MRKTISAIALLLSLLTVLSFSAFSVSADDSSESVAESVAESVVESTVESAAESAAESVTESGSAAESDVESGSESETESGSESASESESSETKEESSASTPDESGFPWALTIFLALVVIFVVVCFICIKMENRFGLWLKKFFKDYKSEIKKIVWPSKEFTVKSTIVVIVCLLVCAAVIGLADAGLAKLFSWIVGLAG